MSTQTGDLRAELEQALRNNDGQLGQVFALFETGLQSNKEIADTGVVANQGVASNLRVIIYAVLDGLLPKSPTRAALTRRAIGGLLRSNPGLSAPARDYLDDLRVRLEMIETDAQAIEAEDKDLGVASRVLEQSLEELPGVYVYTLPSFYRTVQKIDPERFWFKVGKTDRVAGVRVSEQVRATGLPEDPWIARVYRHSTKSPKEIETAIHSLLDAAGHSRAPGKHAGRDWFATNLEFLDALALALGCEIATREPVVE